MSVLAKDYGHGDTRTYMRGCRCTDCRTANTANQQTWKARQDPAAADRAGHGKASTYRNYGCRCDRCTAANTERAAEFRARRRKASTS